MKLLSFSTDRQSAPRLGAHVGNSKVIDIGVAYRRIYEAEPPNWFDSVSSLVAGGETARNLANEVVSGVTTSPMESKKEDREERAITHDADNILFHPVASRSAKILCVTINYETHAAASSQKPAEEPFFFIKMPNGLVAHKWPVIASKTSKKCDSEIELAVVIGKRGKYIPEKEALSHVAGYTIANDFSFRDRRTAKSDPTRLNWLTLKNLDTSAPLGPWLVTKDEIEDPYKLKISITLDNDPNEIQVGSTSDMIHKIPKLIENASNGLTLEPGDVICTGTPHQIAFGHERFLKEGDIIRAEIEGIGTLVNPVVGET